METSELQKMANETDFSWIKIKRYHDLPNSETRFSDFEKHHIEETTFLINKIRQLSRELLDYRNNEN